MEASSPGPDHDHGAAPAVALCTAGTSSLAGVYVLTTSIAVTVIAAVVVLGLGATFLARRR